MNINITIKEEGGAPEDIYSVTSLIKGGDYCVCSKQGRAIEQAPNGLHRDASTCFCIT